ncbi:MAG: hypothetical protein ACRD1K_11905 [Acidimicrobiales bacterium]
MLISASCKKGESDTNVRPPQPGVPARSADVTGIYRTIRNSVIQLRANGDFFMLVPDVGAANGTWSLVDGRFQVSTNRCDDQQGQYELEVTGEGLPGKAQRRVKPVDDPCAERKTYLT